MRTISPQGSKRLFIASLLLLYLLMLALNLFTPFGMDDYYYAFSCLTGERMTRLDQLIPSLIAHGKVMNGRYAAHFFVQLFAMLPNFIFDLCNAAVFVLLVLGLYRLAGGARHYDVRLLLLVGCPVFLLLPDFGSPVLWMSGSLNYLWFGTLAVWMLIPFRNALIDQAAARSSCCRWVPCWWATPVKTFPWLSRSCWGCAFWRNVSFTSAGRFGCCPFSSVS